MYELKKYEGVGHTVTPAILAQAQAFLLRIVPDAPHLGNTNLINSPPSPPTLSDATFSLSDAIYLCTLTPYATV